MALNPQINNNLTALPIDENYKQIQGVFRNIASGIATVATPGTPVQLIATPTQAKSLDVTASYNNTDMITVGGSGVVGTAIGRKGVPIAPGNTYTFKITDVSQVWIDAVSAGDFVSFNWFW